MRILYTSLSSRLIVSVQEKEISLPSILLRSAVELAGCFMVIYPESEEAVML